MSSRFRPLPIAFLLLLIAAMPLSAAPDADPWPRWEIHDPDDTRRIDHGEWADLLDRFRVMGTDGIARFRYGALGAADRDRLETYLNDLTTIDIDGYARDQQFGYWINLYNALTVRVVLDHWPVNSIRDIDISPGWFADGPWGAKLITVAREELSLDDIEHRILRPLWGDARIHFALNCAALGCPNLAGEPFEADRLDAQLDTAARTFMSHPRAVDVLPDGRLRFSTLFRWYGSDFGPDEAARRALLAGWASAENAALLRSDAEIGDHAYDWRLNAP